MSDFIYKLDASSQPNDLAGVQNNLSGNQYGTQSIQTVQPMTEDIVNGLVAQQLRTQTERMILANGSYQSQNFITGASGWQIDASGNCEFGNGVFRGTITATAGVIGGATIGATTIVLGSGANAITLDSATGIISAVGSTWSLHGDGTVTGFSGATYVNGTTTKDATDASTTQNIAHGLGTIPKKVKLEAIMPDSANHVDGRAITVYNGTTQSSISRNGSNGGTVTTVFNLNDGGTAAGNTQIGVVTFDATNIIITWTKTGSPTGTFTILWEAEG